MVKNDGSWLDQGNDWVDMVTKPKKKTSVKTEIKAELKEEPEKEKKKDKDQPAWKSGNYG